MGLATLPKPGDRFDFRLAPVAGGDRRHSVRVVAVAQHGDRTGVLYIRESTGQWFGQSLDDFLRAYPHPLGSDS